MCAVLSEPDDECYAVPMPPESSQFCSVALVESLPKDVRALEFATRGPNVRTILTCTMIRGGRTRTLYRRALEPDLRQAHRVAIPTVHAEGRTEVRIELTPQRSTQPGAALLGRLRVSR